MVTYYDQNAQGVVNAPPTPSFFGLVAVPCRSAMSHVLSQGESLATASAAVASEPPPLHPPPRSACHSFLPQCFAAMSYRSALSQCLAVASACCSLKAFTTASSAAASYAAAAAAYKAVKNDASQSLLPKQCAVIHA